jgi:hypothetical protein
VNSHTCSQSSSLFLLFRFVCYVCNTPTTLFPTTVTLTYCRRVQQASSTSWGKLHGTSYALSQQTFHHRSGWLQLEKCRTMSTCAKRYAISGTVGNGSSRRSSQLCVYDITLEVQSLVCLHVRSCSAAYHPPTPLHAHPPLRLVASRTSTAADHHRTYCSMLLSAIHSQALRSPGVCSRDNVEILLTHTMSPSTYQNISVASVWHLFSTHLHSASYTHLEGQGIYCLLIEAPAYCDAE